MYYNYVLSDESINSKGFIILTDGIDLTRFNENPVLLHNHDINQVVGHWENVRINEQNVEQLVGTAVFDYSDPKSQEVMNKVAKNLIKHVSVGLEPLEFYQDIVDDEDVIVITKSILKEASVTPLPANENAIKLSYKGSNIESIEDALQLNINKNNDMNSKLLELTNEVAELKVSIKENETLKETLTSDNESLKSDIELKDKEIETLTSEVESLKSKLDEIAKAEAELKFNALLDEAIESAKIKESQKEDFLKLTYDNAKLIIDGLESKNSKPEIKLTDKIVNTEISKEEKNIRWYEKNDPEALKLMYNEDRERYDKLFNEYYK